MSQFIGYMLLGACMTVLSPYKRLRDYPGILVIFYFIFEIVVWASILFTLRKGVSLAWGI